MKHKKNCIYIVSTRPVFNFDAATKFENLSVGDSTILFSDLLGNFVEILSNKNLNSDIIYCLNKLDKNSIPKGFFPQGAEILFTAGKDLKTSFNKLGQNYFKQYENNILIRANAIGISVENILKIFDLLSIEDDVLVIGQSDNKKISFIGFNSIIHSLLIKMFSVTCNYDDFLIEAGKNEYYINIFQGFQLIEDSADFKNLYIDLSKKESLSYCSEIMHERFTSLFIEYKDLLK